MAYALMAHHDGIDVMIDTFETYDEAEHFGKMPYIIVYSKDDQDTIEPEEMWVEPYDEIPFADPMTPDDLIKAAAAEDELPF